MDTLEITINSPERVIWEGVGTAVSSENSHGPFDVLPFHANFVTIIENKPIYVRYEDSEEEFLFKTAVLSVRSNFVTIYTDL